MQRIALLTQLLPMISVARRCLMDGITAAFYCDVMYKCM